MANVWWYTLCLLGCCVFLLFFALLCIAWKWILGWWFAYREMCSRRCDRQFPNFHAKEFRSFCYYSLVCLRHTLLTILWICSGKTRETNYIFSWIVAEKRCEKLWLRLAFRAISLDCYCFCFCCQLLFSLVCGGYLLLLLLWFGGVTLCQLDTDSMVLWN